MSDNLSYRHSRPDTRNCDKLIAEAAYYRAEKREFAPGYTVEDWLAAEAQVDFELARARPQTR